MILSMGKTYEPDQVPVNPRAKVAERDAPSHVDPKDDPFIKRGFPGGDACTGKLPKELADRLFKDIEDLRRRVKESEGFDIQVPYMVELGWDEPFLGSLSRRIAKVPTLYLPTAGVTCSKKGFMTFFYNPVFMHETEQNDAPAEKGAERDKLLAAGKQFIRGITKHELFHLIYEHCTSRRTEPHTLWNVATDLAINSLIPRHELPDFCLFPGESPTPKNPPPDYKPSLIAKKIATLPKEKASEWYMAELLNDPDIKEAMAKARAAAKAAMKGKPGKGPPDPNGQGSPGGDQPSDQPGDGDEEREFDRQLRKELYGDNGGQFDDHDVWDEMSEADRDRMRDAMRDIFRDCVKEAERSNGWGSVPGSMQEQLKKLISNQVDWRDVLSQFIGRARSTTQTSSFKRMSRRCPWDFPGRKRSYTIRCAAAMDESGSMHNDWIELLFAELSNLGNLTEFDVLPFSTVVNEEGIQTVTRTKPAKFIRTECGGTDFNAPVRYVNKHQDKYDALIILTDGCCFKPDRCEKPLIYVLAPGCKLEFEAGEAMVVQMTDTREKK